MVHMLWLLVNYFVNVVCYAGLITISVTSVEITVAPKTFHHERIVNTQLYEFKQTVQL